MSEIETAVDTFMGDCNCCQAILLTYATKLGFDKETALRLGTGFADGMARHGEVCGAVTGAIMTIGLKLGMEKNGDAKAREKTLELINEFIKKFKDRHIFIRCNELLGCNINLQTGREYANETDRFKTICPKYVRTAAEILEEIL